MMERKLIVGLAAMALLVIGAVGTARADVLFDFNDGTAQGWWRFGYPTLDFGNETGHGPDGSNNLFLVENFQPSWWGGAVKSPDLPTVGIDLSQYTAFSADVELSTDVINPADPHYPGPVQVELMLNLPGYLEWAKLMTVPDMNQGWFTIASTFADLIPQNLATAPITQAQLQDPSLEIRVLLRNLLRDPADPSGKFIMRVDNVTAIPEPASVVLLAFGVWALTRRRS